MAAASLAKVGMGDRVMLNVEPRQVRRISMLAIAGTIGCLILLVAGDHHAADWHTPGRLTWSLSLLTAVILAARGGLLGRPVTVGHAAIALVMLLTGLGAHSASLDLLGDGLVAGAGAVLMWPMASRPDPNALPRVWALIQATHGDPLAPFAMQSTKSYYFDADATAAIAYRTRLGFAVVSGDPIGQGDRFPALVREFAMMCRSRGWRIIVLGCGEQWLGLWRDADVIGQSLRPIPFGRDVVIDVNRFNMAGRKYRNLRQAVQRSRNFGITTEVVAEQGLDDALRDELAKVLYASHRGARVERGFSMILDHVLEGRYPGIK
ncbi:MAG: phosphatidylglycerol lysyltransferase domain-containing protein, partial [Mycobacterium sp.]